MKRKLIPPTDEEDAIITAAALSDPDNPPLTNAEPAQFRRMPGQRGKKKSPVKVPTTIRLDADVLAALRATGPGWQSRLNAKLREWVQAR